MVDRYGVEWRLTCVLPDIPSDKIQSEQDIEECLTIKPSKETGNGLFMANFQLKPLVQEVHRQDDPETIAKKLAGQSISALEKEQIDVKPKRRKKSQARKKGEMLKIRLPKALRASVERLSIPRLFSAGREKFELIKKKSGLNKKKDSRQDIKLVDHQNYISDGIENNVLTSEIYKNNESFASSVDITVYGNSIKAFFNPRNDAIEALKRQNKSMQKIRWSFPVPNPTVWK